MARKLLLIAVITVACLFSAACAKTGSGLSPDAQFVYDTVYNDKEAFENYCSKGRDGMRTELTSVITDLAKEGKITGDFNAIGNAAGYKLGRKCATQ